MALQADADFERLLFRFLSGCEHPSNAWAIHCDRFFHEDILALSHGFFEVNGANSRRSRQHDNIRKSDGLFVGFKTDKLSVFRDIYFVLGLLLENIEPIL